MPGNGIILRWKKEMGPTSGPELVTHVRGSEDDPLPILKGKSLAGIIHPQE